MSVTGKEQKPYRYVLFLLILVFIGYSGFIYTTGSMSPDLAMSDEALQGERLWRKKNCQACHQLYGLGGYLGPDLTNTVSDPAKGPDYVKAFLNLGIRSMPHFSFSEEEKDQILAYLSHVNKTGYYPNREAELKYNGWVKLKYKKTGTD